MNWLRKVETLPAIFRDPPANVWISALLLPAFCLSGGRWQLPSLQIQKRTFPFPPLFFLAQPLATLAEPACYVIRNACDQAKAASRDLVVQIRHHGDEDDHADRSTVALPPVVKPAPAITTPAPIVAIETALAPVATVAVAPSLLPPNRHPFRLHQSRLSHRSRHWT